MSLKIKDIKIKGYERVIHATNEITKLDCIIAIHNTKLGPALGGVRSWGEVRVRGEEIGRASCRERV